MSTSEGRRSATMARRRAREREILAATRALFDERGVRDAQIEDIARAVGVNRAIVYRHFTGKEELFALTLVSYLDELRDRLSAVPESGTHSERLAGMIRAFVDFGSTYPAFVDCAQTLMRRPGPELLDEISEGALFRLGRGISESLDQVVRVLTEGTEQGEFKVADPLLLANTLYASGLGALQLARIGLLVKQSSPGIPSIVPVSADQICDQFVATALALARG
ncbi:TetR/AcrR family transcriptional regulator [Nocardioides limicola]|uniref:TetR/AcrR family transcriptional regulator n=1 Tax=Nocardioides limicola TaxID=2803368 RepID=UPI00193C477B|nr:TetR/AcrR family transcriptional regulator [Nocardioides sp. DJM-14]